MSSQLAGWIIIGLGVLLALTGKRLFWLAVGIAGFGVGWLLSGAFLSQSVDDLGQLLVGLILGVVCALVAVRGLPLIGMALGAVLMGLLGLTLADLWAGDNTLWKVVGFVVGAAIGVFLVKGAFDVGIALVTAIGGGVLVWNGLPEALPSLPTWIGPVAGLVLAIVGFIAQRGAKGAAPVPS
jgi:hypothetical protein